MVGKHSSEDTLNTLYAREAKARKVSVTDVCVLMSLVLPVAVSYSVKEKT